MASEHLHHWGWIRKGKGKGKGGQVLGDWLVGRIAYLYWLSVCVCVCRHVSAYVCVCMYRHVGGRNPLLGSCEEWSSLTQGNHLPPASPALDHPHRHLTAGSHHNPHCCASVLAAHPHSTDLPRFWLPKIQLLWRQDAPLAWMPRVLELFSPLLKNSGGSYDSF